MPAPLSRDIGERIVASKRRGDRNSKIARDLQVSESAISRLFALEAETGSIEPRPLNNGRKARLDKQMLDCIQARIEEQPDISLQELIEEFTLPVSAPSLCKTINKKLGLVRKKNGTRGRTTS